MLRAALLAAFLVALAAVPAASARTIDLCEPGAYCVATWSYGTTSCVGVAIGLQGGGVCRDSATNCVLVGIGFNEIGTCGIILP